MNLYNFEYYCKKALHDQFVIEILYDDGKLFEYVVTRYSSTRVIILGFERNDECIFIS